MSLSKLGSEGISLPLYRSMKEYRCSYAMTATFCDVLPRWIAERVMLSKEALMLMSQVRIE